MLEALFTRPAQLLTKASPPSSILAPSGLGSWLLSLYLGLAPVYHLPVIGDEYLRLLKAALAVAALAVVLGPSLWSGRLRLPTWTLAFLLLVLLSVPGLLQTPEPSLAVMFVLDLGYAAGLMWCFFWLARQGEDVNIILIRALLIITALAAAALATTLVKMLDWPSPCQQLWLPEYQSWFGSSRNHWAISLSLYLPVVVLLMVRANNWSRELYANVIGIALAGILLGNQLLTSGRTGLLATISSLALLTFPRVSRWLALSLLTVVIALVGMAFFDRACARHLRLDQIVQTPLVQTPSGTGPASEILTTARLRAITTNRTDGYMDGLKRIAERPLQGHGIRQVLVEGRRQQIEIHNLWLKWAVYSGILAPLWFMVMVGFVLFFAFRRFMARPKHPEDRVSAIALILILLSGLGASLLEPNALIGAFQYTAIWWAVAGIIVGAYSPEKGGQDWLTLFPLFPRRHRQPPSPEETSEGR